MLLIPATAILPHVHSCYTSLMSVQLWQTSVFQPTMKKGRCLEKKKKSLPLVLGKNWPFCVAVVGTSRPLQSRAHVDEQRKGHESFNAPLKELLVFKNTGPG